MLMKDCYQVAQKKKPLASNFHPGYLYLTPRISLFDPTLNFLFPKVIACSFFLDFFNWKQQGG